MSWGLKVASENELILEGACNDAGKVAALLAPATRLVKALTSASARVLLSPSINSAGRRALLGPNAPSPVRIPFDLPVKTAQVP